MHDGAVLDQSVDGKQIDSAAMVEFLANWVDHYPICSVEDGLDESDWDGWATLTSKIGDKVQLVGDDLFVTNTRILGEGIEKKVEDFAAEVASQLS